MKDNQIFISVIMPALNEERNILASITNTLLALDAYSISGEVIVVNDGSTDSTENLVNDIIKKDIRVRVIRHDKPCGIGASFWDGVDNARGQIIVMLPGDNECNPQEIFRYHRLLEHVDIVIPFTFNSKEVRTVFRNTVSFIYRFIINATFRVNFNYTNGTVMYRRSILKELDYRSSSFFFQTDILIRTVKKGYLFAEVPYRLGVRKEGVSKAISFSSLRKVAKGYIRLVKDYYGKRDIKRGTSFAEDSLTAIRRHNGD